MQGFRGTGPTLMERESFQHRLKLQFTNIYHSFPFHTYLEDAHNHQEYAEAFDLLWPDELITIPVFTPWRHYVTAEYPDVERMAIHKATATMSVKMRQRKFTSHMIIIKVCTMDAKKTRSIRGPSHAGNCSKKRTNVNRDHKERFDLVRALGYGRIRVQDAPLLAWMA